MALPSLGGVAKVAGKKALGAVSAPLVDMKNQIVSPIAQVFKPFSDFIKEASKESKNTTQAVKETGQKQATSMDGLTEAINTLNSTLSDFFAKQAEMAENQARVASLEDRTPSMDAVATGDTAGGDKAAKGAGGGKFAKMFAPITEMFSGLAKFAGILKVAAIGVAIPALISFFQSDAFVKIKEFVVDKWPSIKEFFVSTFETVLDFFSDMGSLLEGLFSSDTSFGEKLKIIFLDLPATIARAIGQIAVNAVDMIGSLFNVDKLGTKIKNSILKFIAAAPGGKFILEALGISAPTEDAAPASADQEKRKKFEAEEKRKMKEQGKTWIIDYSKMDQMDTAATQEATPQQPAETTTTQATQEPIPSATETTATQEPIPSAAETTATKQTAPPPPPAAERETAPPPPPPPPAAKKEAAPPPSPPADAKPVELPAGIVQNPDSGRFVAYANVWDDGKQTSNMMSQQFKTVEEAVKWQQENNAMTKEKADQLFTPSAEEWAQMKKQGASTNMSKADVSQAAGQIGADAMSSAGGAQQPIIIQNNTNNTSTQNSPNITAASSEKAEVPLN